MKITLRLILLLLFFSGSCFSQSTLPVNFHIMYGDVPLKAGNEYADAANGKLTFTMVRLYVSSPVFYSKGKKVHAAPQNYYLLDVQKPESLLRTIPVPEGLAYDEVRFLFGIDEKTNDAGIGSGDLDPTNGMYWAWQSGYINMKLEGTTAAGEFIYHIGGFLAPYLSARQVALAATDGGELSICIDLKELLARIDLSKNREIMSPGVKAMEVSDRAQKMFCICR